MSDPIRVEVVGIDSVRAAIRAFGKDVENGIEQAINATALETITDVRKAIQGPPKTGRIYKRGTKRHQASAPGEAPATDTGALASSIYFQRPNPLTAVIGSRLVYAAALEFGRFPDLEGTKRPAWLPAAERAGPRLQKRVERVIQAAKAKAEKRTK